jgi:hypothetical protein
MTLGGVEQELCRQKALRCAAMRQSVRNLSDYSKALQTLGQKRWWVGFGAPLSPTQGNARMLGGIAGLTNGKFSRTADLK